MVASLVGVATLSTTASTAADANTTPSDQSNIRTAAPNTPPGPGCATLKAQNVPHPWVPVTANANASLGQLSLQEGRTYTFPPGEVIYVPCGGFRLVGNEHVTTPPTTINGNGDTFIDYSNYPCSGTCGRHYQGRAAFTIVGGANVTLENMTIVGINSVPGVGGKKLALEANGGIDVQGVSGLTISNVKVSHVYGHCLALDPEVEPGLDLSKVPDTNVTLNGFTAGTCGMQGVSLVDVIGLVASGLNIGTSGEAALEVENDFQGAGASGIYIKDCVGIGGTVMLDSSTGMTNNWTINNCPIDTRKVGYAVWVKNKANPIKLSMENDQLYCGTVPVGCIHVDGGQVNVSNSLINVGYVGPTPQTVHVYQVINSVLNLINDRVCGAPAKGYGLPPMTSSQASQLSTHPLTLTSGTSTVNVSGGSWPTGQTRCPTY